MQEAGGAELRLPDGSTTFGRLADAQVPARGGDAVALRLVPEAPIGADRVGAAVELRLAG